MNPGKSLSIQAGPDALALIRDEGLRPERVRIVPAASGGPKWLVLSALDRYLFGTFLAGGQTDWRPSAHPSGAGASPAPRNPIPSPP